MPLNSKLARLRAEGAGAEVGAEAFVAEAVFHVHDHGAAEAVQAEQRRGAAGQRDIVDGGLRQQIPVDRVAERFVDADAVLINGDSLGQAEQGRNGETAILQVRLQGVVLGIVQGNAAEGAAQKIGETRGDIIGNRLGIGDLHRIGNLAEFQARVGRRNTDDDDFLGVLRQGGRGQQQAGDDQPQSSHVEMLP